MTSVQDVAILAAALTSLLLAIVGFLQGPATRLRWSFALGMLAFAAEALAIAGLFVAADTPEARLFWLRMVLILGFLVLLPWGAFVTALTSEAVTTRPSTWPIVATIGGGLALAGAVTTALLPPADIADVEGVFYAAPLAWSGRYGIMAQLLGTAALLGGLEAALRVSTAVKRWRIKYLVLGLGGIFLMRFYLLSQVLLFQVFMASYLTSAAAAVAVGNVVVGAALLRKGLVEGRVTVSRQVLYRSVVLLVLGLYLFAIGGLSWLLQRLEIADELFWISLLVFASAAALATVLLSEDIRWRMKRFIARHFYKSKYDYRSQWVAFTRRLGSLVSIQELAPELLRATMEAVGATRGALYLSDDRNVFAFPLAAASAIQDPPAALPCDIPIIRRAADTPQPVEKDLLGSLPLEGIAIAVPLRWQGRLIGLMLLGPERAGGAYSGEDVEFLTTIGQQGAGAIVTCRLSETVARSREFEAFHRLTSFVVHDLKNASATLSLLTRNALENFDDAEFQRDAIKTLSRTVEKMRLLLRRLDSARDLSHFEFIEVDLRALALDVAGVLPVTDRIRLVSDCQPAPHIQGDVAALTSVVQNLVTNAIEAMEGQGQLTFRTGSRDGTAFCSIGDTGCGMSPDFVRQSLFVPFQSTKKGGWGIGLYQVHQIVTAHQGRIEVDSAEGRGTTFTLLFPAVAESAPIPRPSALYDGGVEPHEQAQALDRRG